MSRIRMLDFRRLVAWVRQRAAIQQVLQEWDVLAASHPAVSPPPEHRLLLIPSDPWSLVGAKGDEAMMSAAVDALRFLSADLRIGVVTATALADEAALSLGYEPLRMWSIATLGSQRDALLSYRPTCALIVGADVMDGHYNPNTTVRLLALGDLLARAGIPTSILGFSFNATPDRRIRPAFARVAKGAVRVNVRDPISLARLKKFAPGNPRLVADVAFLLRPDLASASVVEVSDWREEQRIAGFTVLGVNIHPMLTGGADVALSEGFARQVADELCEVMHGSSVSVCLLSHDYRGDEGDDRSLEVVHAILHARFGTRVLYPRGRFSAAELKAMAGRMDAVLTGRMHLAIASLGMGRPVAALTYQDKFQGLFSHFGLPDHLLQTPQQAALPGSIVALIERLLRDLSMLEQQVARQLPSVLQSARRNLDGVSVGDG